MYINTCKTFTVGPSEIFYCCLELAVYIYCNSGSLASKGANITDEGGCHCNIAKLLLQ